MTIGTGYTDHYLSGAEVRGIVAEAAASLAVDGKRVLVIIPDGTRTMPMPVGSSGSLGSSPTNR